MTLREAIAETIKRADKDQEFLRQTLARRRAEATEAQAKVEQPERKMPEQPEPQKRHG